MPSLSLCMIVKNEEKHLARCLTSVKDVVDEIVIVDTGSTDKTISIAESFNAKIFHFDWINDFSAARNFALRKCNSDWILYLDADEELNPNSIYELLSYKSHALAGVYCTVKSIGTSNVNGSVMKYTRLFSNVTGIEFLGKVHEQVVDSLKKNKIPLIDSEIEIIHHGYAIDEEGLKQKKERNLLLLLSNENKKSNIYESLKLIQTLISLDNFDEAELRINKLVKSKSLATNHLSLVLFYKAQIKFEKNDLKSALEFALKSYKNLKDKPELSYLIYLIFLRSENYSEALEYILITIKSNKNLLDSKSKIESENVLDQTDLYLRAINLYFKLNHNSYIENLISVLAYYISKNQNIEKENVQSLLENLFLKFSVKDIDSDLLKKIIYSKHLATVIGIIKNCEDENSVINSIDVLIKIFPESSTLYKNLAQLYINSNQVKAIELFNKSLEIENDPSVYINLISIYISQNDYRSVKQCFNSLQSNCSDKPQIKQKIDFLKEKLNPILKNSESFQPT